MQQSMEQLQRSGLMPPGAFPGATPQPFTPSLAGAAGTSPIAGLDFSSLLAAAGTGGSPAPAPLLGGDPAVRFASQLRQLAEMGFTDQSANIRALTASGGNVNAAVERLLSGM
jgi:ubiquilin